MNEKKQRKYRCFFCSILFPSKWSRIVEIRQLYTMEAQRNAIQFLHHMGIKERKYGCVENSIDRWLI